MLKCLIDYLFNRLFNKTPSVPAELHPCKDCGHALQDHNAGPEGICIECNCAGWVPDNHD